MIGENNQIVINHETMVKIMEEHFQDFLVAEQASIEAVSEDEEDPTIFHIFLNGGPDGLVLG